MTYFRIKEALAFSAAVLPVAVSFHVPLSTPLKDAPAIGWAAVSPRSPRWLPETRVISSTRRKYSPNDDNESEKDPLQFVANTIGTPTPWIPELPLGYPLALLGVVIVFFPSPVAAIVPFVLFGIFRYLGKDYLSLEEDQDKGSDNIDSPLPVDLVAFVAAILSSLLVVPTQGITTVANTANVDYSGAIPAALLLVLVAAGGAIWQFLQKESKEETPVERRRMDLWDDEFNSKSR